jgi:hypothetical protein
MLIVCDKKMWLPKLIEAARTLEKKFLPRLKRFMFEIILSDLLFLAAPSPELRFAEPCHQPHRHL